MTRFFQHARQALKHLDESPDSRLNSLDSPSLAIISTLFLWSAALITPIMNQDIRPAPIIVGIYFAATIFLLILCEGSLKILAHRLLQESARISAEQKSGSKK